MKISTWNVNGLRAALTKGLMGWVEDSGDDVICLQEVRAQPQQIELEAIQRISGIFPSLVWNPASRPGYSGVAVFSRQPPLEVHLGLGKPEFDSEGRVIWLRFPDFLLFNIYFPNGGHDKSRVPFKLDFYAHLLEMCQAFHARGEQVILCGDFNTAHREIDLKNPKENEQTSGFLAEERLWIDRYLDHGFVDVYRHLYPQREQYTWWTYRFNARKRGIGWRLDYFLVSKTCVDQVRDVVIQAQVLGSDHCPVTLQIESY